MYRNTVLSSTEFDKRDQTAKGGCVCTGSFSFVDASLPKFPDTVSITNTSVIDMRHKSSVITGIH